MIKIDELIAKAMKDRDKVRLNTFRLIKTEFVKAEKNGTEMNDAAQLKILLKMVEQRKEAIEQFTNLGRKELADELQAELSIINEFVPKQASEEEIKQYTNDCISKLQDMNDADWKLSMKDMKSVLAMVQEKYPTANGKIVSIVLKERI